MDITINDKELEDIVFDTFAYELERMDEHGKLWESRIAEFWESIDKYMQQKKKGGDMDQVPNIVNDKRTITELGGMEESWKLIAGSNSVKKITAYLETDGSTWFLVDRLDGSALRINARYVDYVNFQAEVPDAGGAE